MVRLRVKKIEMHLLMNPKNFELVFYFFCSSLYSTTTCLTSRTHYPRDSLKSGTFEWTFQITCHGIHI